ncbi:hypothetical protein Tco_0813713 [Tanacetum coccineum]
MLSALIIPILSYSSKESVGSHVPRVILFGAIPVVILVFPVLPAEVPIVPAEVPIVPADPLVAPEVGAFYVTSPVRVLNLIDYSSFDSDPSKDSLPLAPELPLVSPFLCSDDSEADSEVASRPSSPSGSSSHNTLAPSSEFPVAPTCMETVSHRSSDHHSSPDFTLESSSSSSSLDSSSGSPLDSLLDTSSVHSSECDTPGHTHSGPSTRVASSRSHTASVPSSTLVSRLIAPTHVDLLPLCKRFRDSYSSKDSREEHMEIGTVDAETVADLGIGDGVDTEDGIGMGVEIAASDIMEDKEEFEAEASVGGTIEMAIDPLVTGGISESTIGDAPDLEGTLYDIAHYM